MFPYSGTSIILLASRCLLETNNHLNKLQFTCSNIRLKLEIAVSFLLDYDLFHSTVMTERQTYLMARLPPCFLFYLSTYIFD